MFADLVVVLSPSVSLPTTAMLLEHGATITRDAQACNLAVVEATDRTEHVPNFEVIRGRRVPVAYALWVERCLSGGRRLPLEHPLTQFDPSLFAGVHFSTSGLPRQLNDNVVGVMRFFGGTYCRHLNDKAHVLVVQKELKAPNGSHCNADPQHSKIAVASRESIAIVPIAWVQKCVSGSQLLPPLTKEYIRKTKRARDDELVTIDLSNNVSNDQCCELLGMPRGRRRSSAPVISDPLTNKAPEEGRILTRSMRREIEAARFADCAPVTRHRAREVAAILSPSSDHHRGT